MYINQGICLSCTKSLDPIFWTLDHKDLDMASQTQDKFKNFLNVFDMLFLKNNLTLIPRPFIMI